MMHKLKHTVPFFPFVFFFYLISSLNVGVAIAGAGENASKSSNRMNPFTPKSFLIRYWSNRVSNGLPKSQFLLSKASPLSARDAATFAKLADRSALSAQLSSFCAAANLLCFPDVSPSLEEHTKDVGFTTYLNKNFTNYGTTQPGGLNSFKNYSDGDNLPVDSFRRYSHGAAGLGNQFAHYAPDSNVADQSFNSYGNSATGSGSDFKNYNHQGNVPNLRFQSYSADANGHSQSFHSYGDDGNSGEQSFKGYGKDGNAPSNDFSSYGNNTNVIASSFSSYGEDGNGANDTFKSYSSNGNNPQNNFNSYGESGNGAVDTFINYRDQSNVGDDTFRSYEKNSNDGQANFENYGQTFNEGSDTFTGYGKTDSDKAIGFKTYGLNTTFKDYAKQGVTFSHYRNESSAKLTSSLAAGSKTMVNRWVEPGKFFRERMLKTGTVMPMPDISDKMPQRSFLPRSISSRLPFSSSKLAEMKQLFHAGNESGMEKMMVEALADCERAPSPGETKRCVGSAEDMIDFAVSVLGRSTVVRTTENTRGSNQAVMIGSVKGINGGRVTKSVSCHQSLFPHLLYYCHSVPQVRVYEADILDPKTKAKVNHGVAVCHIDTSAWSAGHGAFLALGSGPGKIEVCHWIFENDMTWTMADT